MHRYVNVIKSAYSIPEYPIKDLLNGTRFTFRLLHLVSRSQDRTQTFIASVGSSRVNKNRKWGCTTVDCINPSCPRLMSTGHWANIRTTAGTTTYSMASKSCETFYGNFSVRWDRACDNRTDQLEPKSAATGSEGH